MNEGVKFFFLVGFDFKINKGFDMITKMQVVDLFERNIAQT